MEVVLQNLTKNFQVVTGRKEDVIAVNDFTFEIPDGKLIGLLVLPAVVKVQRLI